jgi:hypothetical protein
MKSPAEVEAYAVGGQLHTMLGAAVADLASMPPGDQRTWALRGVATLLMDTPESFKAAAVEQCPELAAAEPIPDTHLSAGQQELSSGLTQADVQALDDALIAGAATSWRNVSRIVGDAIVTLQGRVPALPLGIYMRRFEAMVQAGRLEARGDTRFMRLSEARRPTGGTSAA